MIGNGIAGVTAVDHVRRRHPATTIDLIAEEPHHLYNRMGIARLVYGKSAMQGLYLNPDAWYGEREIETWLNTRALAIDRAAREVQLGTGERLPYDRADPRHGLAQLRAADRGLRARRHRRAAQGRRRRAHPLLRPAPRLQARHDRRRRAARPRGGLRAAPAGHPLDGARAQRPPAQAPARRARRRAAAALSGRSRARDRHPAPRRRPSAARAGSTRSTCRTGARSTPRSCSSRRASSPTPSWPRRRTSPPTAACSSTRACRPATRTSSPPATSPSSRDRSQACGRPRSRRPRSPPTTRSAETSSTRAVDPGHDPQSRGHRAHVDRPLRGGRPARGGDRPRRRLAGATASSWWRTAASWARSSWVTPRRSRPSAPRSPAATTSRPSSARLRAGRWDGLAGLSGERPLAPAVPA